MSDHPNTSGADASKPAERISRLRLVRRPATTGDPEVEKSAADRQRERIIKGLEELRAINSREAYRQASANGVAFTLDGFRARVGVGTNTLHYTHSDLFRQLTQILDFIYPTFVGVPRNTKGRSPTPRSLRKNSEKDDRIAELEARLERREAQFLDLVDKLKNRD
jgi:hypothetical protein